MKENKTEKRAIKFYSKVRVKATLNDIPIQYTLDLRKPDLRKNLDLRKIVATTDFLVHTRSIRL